MKTKNTGWTAEEDAVLVKAAKDKTGTLRLSIRLRRSEASIKRRMRELGLAGNKRTPFDAVMMAKRWLAALHARDLRGLISLYAEDATLECECTGAGICVGRLAIQEYWTPKLCSAVPNAFTLIAARQAGERVALDYMSYEGKPVRMYLTFEDGTIVTSICGPRFTRKAA